MSALGIVLGGGSGQRAGLGHNKVLADLDGRSVLRRSVEALAAHVDRVVVVARPGDRAAIEQDVGDLVAAVVDGGATRHDSERAGMRAVRPTDDVVLIHDGARPLVSAALVTAVRDLARDGAAVVPALPRAVPIARWPRGREGPVVDDAVLLDRSALVGVQTPQGAPVELLWEAFEAVARADDAPSLQLDTVEPVLRHLPQLPVVTVPGDPRNIKLTWPSDLREARRLVADPELRPVPPALHLRSGMPTGGRPFVELEVDGVVPVTDALRTVESDRVTGALDRAELVDLTGDLLASPGVMDEDVEDLGAAVEAAVAGGARLRLRRRR